MCNLLAHKYSGNAELEIRTVKCSDTCQHNIKLVLTFTKNDLTLVLRYGTKCWLGHMSGIVQVNIKSGRKISDVLLLFHTLLIYLYA